MAAAAYSVLFKYEKNVIEKGLQVTINAWFTVSHMVEVSHSIIILSLGWFLFCTR
jgi:hypothetical protein